MTTKTFTSTRLISTHGTRKAAEAAAARRGAGNGTTHAVEHTGPRLFSVIMTTTVTSEPRPATDIMSGQPFICGCGSTLWYYTGRTLFSLDYECAGCERKISPLSETGASQ